MTEADVLKTHVHVFYGALKSQLVRTFPPGSRWESGVIMAEGDLVMVHSRYSGREVPTNLIAVDILRVKDEVLVEHWDVLQDEVSKADSKSGLPMFGTEFSY